MLVSYLIATVNSNPGSQDYRIVCPDGTKATSRVVTDYYLIGSKEDVVGTAQQNCSHRKYGGGQPNKFSFEYVALCLAKHN